MTIKQKVGLLGILICAGLAFLILQFDVVFVLVAVCLLALSMLVIAMPDTSTMAALFIIYTNMAVVARTFYSLPDFVVNSFSIFLVIPMLSYLVIQRQKLVVDRVIILMLVFLVAMLLSSINAIDANMSMARIVDYLLEGLVLYFLIINVIRNPGTLRRSIWAVIIAGSLLGGLTLYQEVTDSYNKDFGGLVARATEETAGVITEEGEVSINRAGGPVDGDPNRFGQILVVLLPLALFRMWGEQSLHLRFISALAFLLILAGMLLTYSRGAFITFTLLLLIMIFLRHIRLYQVLIAIAALALLITAAAPGYLTRIETIRGVEGLFYEESEQEPDYVTRSRITEMLAALNVFIDYPVLGVGPGQYSKYYSVEYQLNPDIALRYIPKTRRAHTLYFELGAETGVIGLASFMSIVLLVLYQLWKERGRLISIRPDLANLATAIFLSILGYLGTSIFLHLSYQRYYWLLIGLGGAAVHIFKTESLPNIARDTDSTGATLRPQ